MRTIRAGVTGDKGSVLQIQLSSYAYVINTETEVVNLFSATETKTLTGYYLLASNVKVSTLDSGEKLTFAGVFDGNGYKLTVPMRAYGLFGRLTGQVKNAWIEFSNVRNINDYDGNNLLAYSGGSQFKVDGEVCNTLENLYITIDEDTFNKELDGTVSENTLTNFSLMCNVNSAIKIQNIIVDYANLLPAEYTKNQGLLVQYYTNPSDTEYWQTMSNFKEIYFISSTLKCLSNKSNTVKLYATNDADKVEQGATKQFVAKNIYRYDNWEKFNQAGHTFANFASEYWTIENNTICWKNK